MTTPLGDAFLSAQRVAEVTGLTADQIQSLPMDEYSRLRIRAGLPDPYTEVYEDDVPGRPRAAEPVRTTPAAPDLGVDWASMTMAEYERIRAMHIHPASGSGVGIFGK